MFKRIVFLLLLINLFACSSLKQEPIFKTLTPQQIINDTIASPLPTPNAQQKNDNLAPVKPKEEKELDLDIDLSVDYDLVSFTRDACYAEVVKILRERKKYIGKTVRVLGRFVSFKGDDGNYTPMIVIADNLGCCNQGLEFKVANKNKDDYPKTGTRILVKGTIKLKEAYNGFKYPYIEVEEFKLV